MSEEIGAFFRTNGAKERTNSAPEVGYRPLSRLSQQCFEFAEALLDVRQEDGAVHRSIDHEWGDDPVMAQTGDKSHCFPMSVGDRCDQSLTARTAASNPYHVCASGGLVNKHQP